MKQMAAVSMLLLMTISLTGCSSSPVNKTVNPTSLTVSKTPASVEPGNPGPKELPKSSTEEAAKRAKRLAQLKPHFVFTMDEFNHTQTIRHKAFSRFMNGNGTTIEGEIYDGRLSVESQYVADHWIFHKSFTVKIGDRQESATGKDQEEVVEGVCEKVTPTFSESESIYKDYTLRTAHQKAIAETVEYFDLTKEN
jgi:hypothetical protein